MLTLESVSYSYGASDLAVREVDLTLRPGSRTVLLGPNGGGKSTVALLAAGLLQPSSGRVAVDPGEKDAPPPVGIVFQDPDDQMVASTVGDDVSFGPANLGLPQAEIEKRVDSALEAVGLQAMADRAITSLSGGERQRVALAGVLALRTPYLILDEVDSMLDPGNRRIVNDIVATVAARGVGVLTITHDPTRLLDADHVLVMDSGSIALEGSAREILGRLDHLHGIGIAIPRYLSRMASLVDADPSFSPTSDPVTTAARAVAAGLGQRERG